MIDFQIILNYNITVVKNSKQKESPKEGSYDKLAADFDCYSFSGLLSGISLVAPMDHENVFICQHLRLILEVFFKLNISFR